MHLPLEQAAIEAELAFPIGFFEQDGDYRVGPSALLFDYYIALGKNPVVGLLEQDLFSQG